MDIKENRDLKFYCWQNLKLLELMESIEDAYHILFFHTIDANFYFLYIDIKGIMKDQSCYKKRSKMINKLEAILEDKLNSND